MRSCNFVFKKKQLALAAAVLFLMAAAGCTGKPSPPMRDFATSYISDAAEARRKLPEYQKLIREHKNINTLDGNPAFLMLRDTSDSLDKYRVRLQDYKSNMKETKQPARDAELEKRLAELQEAFSYCALETHEKVSADLPEYYKLWEPAAPDAKTIMKHTRRWLGLKPGAKAGAGACRRFDSLADALRRELRMK